MRATRLIDLTGRKFGRLKVLQRGVLKNGHIQWDCVCDCGILVSVNGSNLRTDHTQSCGCLFGYVQSEVHGTHHETGSVEHVAWKHIIGRCHNPKNRAFKWYGARGLTVCKRWRKYENFLADMGRKPSPKHSIERRNNNLGYRPSNCVWATATEQANNRRSVPRLRLYGVTLSVPEWARIVGTPPKLVSERVKNGWPVKQALGLEVRK